MVLSLSLRPISLKAWTSKSQHSYGVIHSANIFLRALVRPGRFDRVIAVPLPDVRGRAQILQQYMKEVVTDPGA